MARPRPLALGRHILFGVPAVAGCCLWPKDLQLEARPPRRFGGRWFGVVAICMVL